MHTILALCLTVGAAEAKPQQPASLVVPASASVTDGSHAYFLAGVAEPRRQQTIIDASLLSSMAGHTITAINFRRNLADGALVGGIVNLTIQLSHSPHPAGEASDHFSQNHGPDLSVAFQGWVTLPNSPAPTSAQVSWTPDNVAQVVLQQPFTYVGGPLTIEVSGTPGTPTVEWWPADAVWQPNGGLATSVGSGSGPFGGSTGEWSFLEASNLGPGGTVTFTALGNPGDLAGLAIAAGTQPNRFDISGLGVPGSAIHILDPFLLEITSFGPLLLASRPALGGVATYAARVPTDPAFLGAQFGSQWFGVDSLGRIASSNAHQWSTATQFPGLGMTLVTAPVLGVTPVVGKVIPACGHVMRFDYQ